MNPVMKFLKAHGVRVFAVLAAAVPLLVIQFPDFPAEAFLALAAATLGVGEVAQRNEQAKQDEALATPVPFDNS
ncbi:hypothetical protein [Streptomyces sp. H39-S7]|uniref:hypothetical protein n=1 Tax=Streptomyces sp. H39-S7 TaxID=3004357 RepID=UPI0022AFE8AB|nr:hypothetical protein [Streptomyces sp. H39-S7]MCZ4119049.1 hypothetical protein [Streptomyces sp. H39-S7]